MREDNTNLELQPIMDPADALFSQYQRRTNWSYSADEETSLRETVRKCTPHSKKVVQDSDILLAFIIYTYKKKQAHSNNLSWTETDEKEQIYREIYSKEEENEEEENEEESDKERIKFLKTIEELESTQDAKAKLEKYISSIDSREKADLFFFEWFFHWTFFICGYTFYFGHCSEIKKTAADTMKAFLLSQLETSIDRQTISLSLQQLHALQQGKLGTIVDEVPQSQREEFFKKAFLRLVKEYIEKRKEAGTSTKYSFLYGSCTIFGHTIYSSLPRQTKINAAKLLEFYLEERTLPSNWVQDFKSQQQDLLNAVQYGRLGGIFKQIPESTRQTFLAAAAA